jgi:hypothetical protein
MIAVGMTATTKGKGCTDGGGGFYRKGAPGGWWGEGEGLKWCLESGHGL